LALALGHFTVPFFQSTKCTPTDKGG
jgi:hypothetical protein